MFSMICLARAEVWIGLSRLWRWPELILWYFEWWFSNDIIIARFFGLFMFVGVKLWRAVRKAYLFRIYMFHTLWFSIRCLKISYVLSKIFPAKCICWIVEILLQHCILLLYFKKMFLPYKLLLAWLSDSPVGRIIFISGYLFPLTWWHPPFINIFCSRRWKMTRKNSRTEATHRFSIHYFPHWSIEELLFRIITMREDNVRARLGALRLLVRNWIWLLGGHELSMTQYSFLSIIY